MGWEDDRSKVENPVFPRFSRTIFFPVQIFPSKTFSSLLSVFVKTWSKKASESAIATACLSQSSSRRELTASGAFRLRNWGCGCWLRKNVLHGRQRWFFFFFFFLFFSSLFLFFFSFPGGGKAAAGILVSCCRINLVYFIFMINITKRLQLVTTFSELVNRC